MSIWQTMMGTSKNPKSEWNSHDDKYQHFSPQMGSTFEGRISKGDLLVIYWPGHRVYMGLSTAAESGPYPLDMFGDYWDKLRKTHPDVDIWKYGMRTQNLICIPSIVNGITLSEARYRIPRETLPGRVGLRSADGWEGVDWLINEIRKRAGSK